MADARTGSKSAAIALLAALAVYAALTVPTIDRQGINWDEHDDRTIALAYLAPGGTWSGSTVDLNQTRLPMFLGALLFRAVGRVSIVDARLLSVAVGALAIVGAWIFCRREWGPGPAAVAAVLLATSPYYVAFSRLAFSEGDVYIACATVWVAVAASRLAERRTVGRAAALGLALGLALSAKLSALALIPAVALHLLATRSAAPARAPRLGLREVVPFALLSAVLVTGGVLGRLLDARGLARPGNRVVLVGFAAIGLLFAAFLAWSVRHRRAAAGPVLQIAIPTAVALCAFLFVPPEHTTNPRIQATIVREIVEGGGSFEPLRAAEFAAIHILTVLVKPSVAIGLASAAAFVFACGRAFSDRGARLLVLLGVSYVGFLLTLPWAQTRYMMPVAVLLAMLLAEAAWRAWRASRAVAAAAALVAVAFLAADYAVYYPDLHLNGYRLLGERYLFGHSTLGYRSVVHVPIDGIEQSLAWVGERAGPGERVLTYSPPRHIVRSLTRDRRYEWIDGKVEPDSLERADWVLTDLNGDILPGEGLDNPSGTIWKYPYDRVGLERDFERVFVVTRACGLEVATVWRRRHASA